MNIGYEHNKNSIKMMNNIVNAIDYIKHGHPSSNEIIKIIQYYEEI